MFKCFFLGHDWKLKKTMTGKRYCSVWGDRCQTTHDLTLEFYECAKCGMWKKKTFIDHQLDGTNFFLDRPIESEQKDHE